MVQIRECMRKWLPFVMMAAALGVSPAQDVASPDAAELDLDLVKLKKGPKGKQREAMRKVLLLVYLKQKETWLAESTGEKAVHLEAEISLRRYLATVEIAGCPEEFKRAFSRYAKLLNSFEEEKLKSVKDFPPVPLQDAGRELFRVLLTYRLEPEHLLEEMKALVDEEIEGKEDLSTEQMIGIVRGVRETLQSGRRSFPGERAPEDGESGM
ncbi:hypothetical protein [uncultured Akkermansia sp.]|uniref:hypothetical protein n=1 Tax=uncultured Akkermansia sp. TaxID=512294 RepID=UPI00265CAE38|nr:hypothetical protein [uncultured Akkermansia sp.]